MECAQGLGVLHPQPLSGGLPPPPALHRWRCPAHRVLQNGFGLEKTLEILSAMGRDTCPATGSSARQAGGGSGAAGGALRAPDALPKLLGVKSRGVWGCLAAQLAGKGVVLSGKQQSRLVHHCHVCNKSKFHPGHKVKRVLIKGTASCF